MLKQISRLSPLVPLIRDFFQLAPARVSYVLALMTLGSMSSGIGILLIIPLLSSVGISLGDQTALTSSGYWLSDFLRGAGLQLNLGAVLLLYLLIIVAVALLNYLNTLSSAKLRRDFVIRLRDQVFRQLLTAQWQYLSSERTSDFARMVTGQVQSMGFTVYQLLNLASRLILVLVYLCLSLWLSPFMTLLALVCAGILVVVLLPLNKRIHRSGRQELSAYSDIFHSVFEQLSSLKIIKGFSAEQRYAEKMSETSRVLENQQVRMTRFNALSRFIFLTGAAAIFSGLFFVAIQILTLPIANLILILFIFSRLMPQLSGVQALVQQLIHAAPEYLDLLEKSAQLEKHQEAFNSQQPAPEFRLEMQLVNISYAYPEKDSPVLKNFSARIKHNQTHALCGPSGVGKSTLADIIAGLITPNNGKVYVDTEELDEQNRLSWRQKVAYVTQDVILFNDSIRANLSWVSNEEIGEEQLWQCLRMAAAEDFVKALPQGLNTEIGDRGIKLSGGERQRLALARALVSEPEILILDEATSALDRENETRIRDALKALDGQLTIIIIAHDQESIAHVQNRIELGKAS